MQSCANNSLAAISRSFIPVRDGEAEILLRWRMLESAMARIVGRHAAAALIRHSIARAQPKFCWLASTQAADPLATFAADLSQQGEDVAAEADRVVRAELSSVLSRFLGQSLARSVLARGDAARLG